MAFAIELHALSKIYSQKNNILFKAVDNLTLTIPQGQIIGFLGPNGAGKTTTIKMICNLIIPTHGSIKLNGYSITENRNIAMSQMGAVLEGTRNIYWQLSAWQNLIYFGKLKGMWGKLLTAQAEKLLKELALWDRKDDIVSEFSRGMQQKVAIACALITNPSIILLDEPTLGLDVQASRTIKSWVEHLAHEEKKTIVLTTHQLDVAEQLCERIIFINKGKIIADKVTADLLNLFHEDNYKITVWGKIQEPITIMAGMTMIPKDDHTVFIGAIVDQESLHEKLSLLHNLQLPLLSVTRVHHNLEEVFMHLMQKQDPLS
jgi:ABC-2 type transport system ATP-binding protein